MMGIGAIVKSVGRWLEGAAASAGRGLRLVLADRRPKPCPIYVQSDADRRRR